MKEYVQLMCCDVCVNVMYPNLNRPEHMCLADSECEHYSQFELDEEKAIKNKELWLQEQFEKKGW